MNLHKLDANAVDLLKIKATIADVFPLRLISHQAGVLVQHLHAQERLKLENTEDLRRVPYECSYTDFTHKNALSTYDELVEVSLHADFSVQVLVRESMGSFRVHRPEDRARFTLTGKWWLIEDNNDSFAAKINRSFGYHCQRLREAEEAQAKAAREEQIGRNLLAQYEEEE